MRGARHLAAVVLSASLILGTAALGQTPAAAQSYQVGEPVVVTVPALNVRAAPSLSGAIVTVLQKDTVVRVVGGPTTADGYLWFQIERAGVTIGWSVAGFISGTAPSQPGEPAPTTPPAGGYAYGASVTVTASLLNVRALPTITGQILTVYAVGRVATITGEPRVADNITWYPVDNLGWVSGAYLTGGGTTTTPPTTTPPSTGATSVFRVEAALLNVRATPGLTGAIVKTVPYGTLLTVTGPSTAVDGYLWFPVDAGGWVGGGYGSGSDYLTLVQMELYVTAGALNVRSTPSTAGAIIGTLTYAQTVNTFDYAYDANGTLWYAIDVAGTRWVAGAYISIRLPE